jgi:hypothetical protein
MGLGVKVRRGAALYLRRPILVWHQHVSEHQAQILYHKYTNLSSRHRRGPISRDRIVAAILTPSRTDAAG